jgi:hypothetical protein
MCAVQQEKTDESSLSKSTQSVGRSFRKMLKRVIKKLGNQELRKIDFYTCRYWRATAGYHITHDFEAVMVLLGYPSIRYVLVYAQLSETYFGALVMFVKRLSRVKMQ